MSLYYNKKLISGVRDVPSMTLAQYNALTNKPKLWIRTDAPEGDRGINADDIQYDSNNSVGDMLTPVTLTNYTINATNVKTGEGDYYISAHKCGKMVNILIDKIVAKVNLSANEVLISGLPKPPRAFTFSAFDAVGTKILHFRIDADGNLRNWYTGATVNTSMETNITYFEAD